MPPWAQILLRVFAGELMNRGKTEQAGVLTDALKVVEAGGNVDDTMNTYAEQWQQTGEPSLESIVDARKAIQAQL